MQGSEDTGTGQSNPESEFEPTLDVCRDSKAADQRISPSTNEQHRYQLLHRHAKGGSGQVSVAIDQKFGRTVAYKEISDERTDEQSVRNLFLREAEVTANLEHPGIVPIYDVGYRQNGSPFYAMRFIEGQSLRVAIRDFHRGHRNSNRLEWQQELRTLIGRLIDVCNAMEYAHSKGVLHRDIKPANVMLGPFGETLIVDWGLAGQVGTSVDSDCPPLQANTLIKDSTNTGESGGLGSTSFAAVGTVGYMSPEQSVRGNAQCFTADIYSLGATLYTILTGRVSLKCDELSELQRRLHSSDFPAPDKSEKRTPGPLNAICQKAMSVVPEDRYQSVAEFSESLRCWLSDQAVEAYSEPVHERAVRWISRHRTIAMGITALLCAAVVGLGINARIANQQKLKTEASLSTLMKTTERFFDDTEDYLVGVPALSDLRVQLLQESHRLHEDMLEENPNHAGVIFRTSKVCVSLAGVYSGTSRPEQAKQAFDRGLQLCDRLQSFDGPPIPHNPETTSRSWYFAAHSIHAQFLAGVAPQPESQKYVEDLLKELEQENGLRPADKRLANANLNGVLSDILAKAGRLDEAIAKMKLASNEFMVNPNASLQQLKSCQDRLADALRQKGELNAAEVLWADTIAFVESELSQPDKVKQNERPSYNVWLAHCIQQQAELWTSLGRTAEAVPELQKAVKLIAPVADRFPGIPNYASSLVNLRISLAVTLCRCGRIEESLPQYEQAVTAISILANRYPSQQHYQQVWGTALKNLATAKYQLQQFSEAEQLSRKVIDLREQLAQSHPQPGNLLALASAQLSFAATLTRTTTGIDEPLAVYQSATKTLEALALKLPGPTLFRSKLALAYQNRADLMGKHWLADAAAFFNKAETQYLQLAAESPENQELQLRLSMVNDNRGRIALQRQEWSRAIESFEPAIEYFDQAWKQGQRDHSLSLKSIRVRGFLAKAYIGHGHIAKAVQVIDKALQTAEVIHGEEPNRYNDRVAELLQLRCEAVLAKTTFQPDDLVAVEQSLAELETVRQLLEPADAIYFQLQGQLLQSKIMTAKQQFDKAHHWVESLIADIESHQKSTDQTAEESDLTELRVHALQQQIANMLQNGKRVDTAIVQEVSQAIQEYAAQETLPIDAIETQQLRLKLITALLKQEDQQNAIPQLQAFSDYVSTPQIQRLTELFLAPANQTSASFRIVSDGKTIYPREIVKTFERILDANPSAVEELRSHPAIVERLKNAGLQQFTN